MSPKTATISLALLALTLTLTLSSAHSSRNIGDHHPLTSIPELLKHYDLPPSIFPDDVQSFHYDPINKDSVRLTINLHGVCVVIREVLGIKIEVKCEKQISAIISPGNLSHVTGVTVQQYVGEVPIGELMTITGAKRVYVSSFKFLVFTAEQGGEPLESPPFRYSLFPKKPPKCDSRKAFYFSDDIVADTNQDIPLSLIPLLDA